MYLNVLNFKNGKTLFFKNAIPFSIDKLDDNEFIVVTDDVNGQILSFRTSEVVTIQSSKIPEETLKETTGKKAKGFKAKVTKE